MLPATLLKKMIIGRFPRKLMDSQIADSIDFMVERVRIVKICLSTCIQYYMQ